MRSSCSVVPFKCPDLNAFAVRLDGHLSIDVGPVDRRANGLQTADYLAGGVAERVAAAAADQRDLRAPAFYQLEGCRCAAAVMSDLEDADACGSELSKNRPL